LRRDLIKNTYFICIYTQRGWHIWRWNWLFTTTYS